MGKETGKASWIPSFQKSPRLDTCEKPHCKPHADCKPAAEESPIDMNVNKQIAYILQVIEDVLAEVEYHVAEPSFRPPALPCLDKLVN